MKIRKDETLIKCILTLEGKRLIESPECARIQWLRTQYLKKISKIEADWLILYQDPADGRYWELRFEYGEMQGGGPPSLICISKEEVKQKYNL